MALILIPVVITVGCILIWGWIKFIKMIFNPMIKLLEKRESRKTKSDNPYVQYHKAKDKNDKMYEEYLEWMHKNDAGLPVDKYMFPEEDRFEKEIRRIMPK